jgi:hypothetical protein
MFGLRYISALAVVFLFLALGAPSPAQTSGTKITINYVIYPKVVFAQMESLLSELAREGKWSARSLFSKLTRQRQVLERLHRQSQVWAGRQLSQADVAAVNDHNAACARELNASRTLVVKVQTYLWKFGRQSRFVMHHLAKTLVDSKRFDPRGDTTYCNQFVASFAQASYGYNGFNGLLADQCVDLLRSDKGRKDGWNLVLDPNAKGDKAAAKLNRNQIAQRLKDAQQRANDGYLVVVAWKDTRPITDKHPRPIGHIAVVVPGEMDKSSASGKWWMRVPWIAQAGSKVFAKDKLSQGFGPNLMGETVIYYRKP